MTEQPETSQTWDSAITGPIPVSSEEYELLKRLESSNKWTT